MSTVRGNLFNDLMCGDEERGFLAKYISKTKEMEGVVVEIGSAVGSGARFILASGCCDKLVLVDPLVMSSGDVQWNTQKQFDDQEKALRANLAGFENYELVKEKSHNAASRFEKGSIKFVFIDGDHTYEGALNDLNDYFPLLKVGGYLAIHDIGHEREVEVEPAFNKFKEEHAGKFVFVDKKGVTVVIKKVAD